MGQFIVVECENNITSCGACSLRKHCAGGEDDRYTRRQRWKAVLFSYVLPFVLLAGVVVGLSWVTDNEAVIGGVALIVVACYYLILFFLKPKI